jgi:tetratricopeptide (TPR) repeat protein
MANVVIAFLLLSGATPSLGQNPAPEEQQNEEGPTSEKPQKSYKGALEYLRQGNKLAALDNFKKADKQDGGHCVACERKIIKYAVEEGDWKAAEIAAGEIVRTTQGAKELALAHYDFGWVLLEEGVAKDKDEVLAHAHDEFSKALATYSNFPDAAFSDGQALGRLSKDDAAKAQFQLFLKLARSDDPRRKRATRYIDEPELARARVFPPSPSQRWMGASSRLTTCRARSSCSTFGPRGASPAGPPCLICAKSPRSSRGSRSSS